MFSKCQIQIFDLYYGMQPGKSKDNQIVETGENIKTLKNVVRFALNF